MVTRGWWRSVVGGAGNNSVFGGTIGWAGRSWGAMGYSVTGGVVLGGWAGSSTRHWSGDL
jgi:hypothetical protein